MNYLLRTRAASEIKRLIELEAKADPISDVALHAYLTARGFEISRNTVRLMRAKLGFKPSHLRRADRPKPAQGGVVYRKTREKLGLTQEQFAAKLNISRSYLAGIENGHCKPTWVLP